MGRFISFREGFAQILEYLSAQVDKFRIFTEEADLLFRYAVSVRSLAQYEEGERFGDILGGVSDGIITHELVPVTEIELIQAFIINFVYLFKIDLVPFFIYIRPEAIIECIDIGIRGGAALAGEVIGAGG